MFVVGLLLGFVYVAGTFFLLKRDTCVPTYRDSECSLLSWGGGVKSEGVKSELALKSYCLESSLY